MLLEISLNCCSQTSIIDDVHRTTGAISDVERQNEGKRIVEDLAKLKYELQHDRALTYGTAVKPLPSPY